MADEIKESFGLEEIEKMIAEEQKQKVIDAQKDYF